MCLWTDYLGNRKRWIQLFCMLTVITYGHAEILTICDTPCQLTGTQVLSNSITDVYAGHY